MKAEYRTLVGLSWLKHCPDNNRREESQRFACNLATPGQKLTVLVYKRHQLPVVFFSVILVCSGII
uniref:Elm1 n=1 Tax=Arundo donax TaxID=35708 RepID=A0A0A9DZK0_ARUDO